MTAPYVFFSQVDSADANFLIPDDWSHPLLPTTQEGVKCYLIGNSYHPRSLFLYCLLHQLVLQSHPS